MLWCVGRRAFGAGGLGLGAQTDRGSRGVDPPVDMAENKSPVYACVTSATRPTPNVAEMVAKIVAVSVAANDEAMEYPGHADVMYMCV